MGVDHPGLPMTMADLIRTIRRIAKATIQNASIGRAGIRVYDGGWIRIEDGGLSVTGTADVSGYLNISGKLTGTGEFAWSGPLKLTGATTVTGPLTVDGSWDLNGNGEIRGNVTVLGGGLIRAGNIEISPSVNGGAIKVGDHTIYVNGAVLTVLHSGGAQLVLNNGGASLLGGGKSFAVQATGVSIGGLPTISRGSANNATIGTVYCNSSGQLFRVV